MSPKALTAARAAVIIILATVPFVRAAKGPFIWDDRYLIQQINQQDAGAIVNGSFLARPDGAGGDYYRPLTSLSLSGDLALWGKRPIGFHTTNLILHALCALAVWALAGRWLKPGAAAAAAGIFAVYPLHCEPVCWISGRSDLLAGLFVFLSVLAFLKWRGSWKVLIAFGCAFLALASKETAAALPLLIPAALWMGGERRPKALILSGLKFGVVAGFFFTARLALVPAEVIHLPGPWTGQLSVAAYSLLMHFQMLVAPANARLGYSVVSAEVARPATWVFLAGLLSLAVLAWQERHGRPVIWFAVMWIGACLLPVLGSAAGLSGTIVAERYVFVASAGAAILVAWALSLLPGFLYRTSVVAAVCALAALCVVRSNLWSDDLVFWRQMVRDAPTMGWGYYNLGNVALERGDLRLATSGYEAASALMPGEKLPREALWEVRRLRSRP